MLQFLINCSLITYLIGNVVLADHYQLYVEGMPAKMILFDLDPGDGDTLECSSVIDRSGRGDTVGLL